MGRASWERSNAPLDGNWQLPRARDRLDDDIRLLHTALAQLGLRAGEQGVDDAVIPTRVDDANAQVAAVVELRGGAFVVHFVGEPRQIMCEEQNLKF